MQKELESFQDRYNSKAKRKNSKSALPRGPPNHIFQDPEYYGVKDYMIHIEENIINQISEQCAPTDHPVFTLLPLEFSTVFDAITASLEFPLVTFNNIWDIFILYLDRLTHFQPNGTLTYEELENEPEDVFPENILTRMGVEEYQSNVTEEKERHSNEMENINDRSDQISGYNLQEMLTFEMDWEGKPYAYTLPDDSELFD